MKPLFRTSMMLAAVCAVGLTAACGGSSDTAGAASSTSVAFSAPVLSQTSQKLIAKGFQDAATSLGWQSRVYDANLSTDTQVSNLQTMVDQQVSAIAAWALDDNAITGAYSQAKNANVPVVALNSDNPAATATIWWDSIKCTPDGAMTQLAKKFAAAKPGGRIVVMSGPPAPSIVMETDCFVSAARQAGLTVIARQDNTQDSVSNAASLAQDLISAHPDVDGFWAYNDNSALGISSALQAAGKSVYSAQATGGVMVTGINADAAAVSAVRNGTLSATVDPNLVCTGWATVDVMRTVLEGKPAPNFMIKSKIVDSASLGGYVAPEQQTCSFDTIPVG